MSNKYDDITQEAVAFEERSIKALFADPHPAFEEVPVLNEFGRVSSADEIAYLLRAYGFTEDAVTRNTRELMERTAASVFNYGFDPAKHGDDHTVQLATQGQLVCVTLEDDDCTTPALGYLKIVQDQDVEDRNREWYAQFLGTFDVKRPEKPHYRWRYPIARSTACAPGHWQLWSLPQDVPRSHQWPAVVVPVRHAPSRAEYIATRRNAWHESDGFAPPHFRRQIRDRPDY